LPDIETAHKQAQLLVRKGVAMAGQSMNMNILGLTAKVVSAQVSNNTASPSEVQSLIHEVYKALSEAGKEPTQPERPEPAVPAAKSVFADYIICLEDGQKLKMLKRHLMAAYNLTPLQYRQRWGLPASYPMVAPNYASQRSALAKKIGLGTGPRTR
jgi:predicted transcriptional regulator